MSNYVICCFAECRWRESLRLSANKIEDIRMQYVVQSDISRCKTFLCVLCIFKSPSNAREIEGSFRRVTNHTPGTGVRSALRD